MMLFNTLGSTKQDFIPIDRECVKLYVCGPTVYDFAHIGNARSAVVYDTLFRLLKKLYAKVIYVRNITDVDDKIIHAAKAKNKGLGELTSYYTKLFHEDMAYLNCLSPTFEPKATESIEAMLQLIAELVERGNAYVKNGTVYFDIKSCDFYGRLSGRKVDDMISGSRVDIDSDKLHPGDFVLWKPSTQLDIEVGACWDSPWGKGRPGWHIECSGMSYSYLGKDFDIHGGGADLMFPHHENELAQSCCAFPGSSYARYWVHNGFLTVNGGEKMSKSLGNIVTVRGLSESGLDGEVIRYVFLSTHYRKPIDWCDAVVSSAKESLGRMRRCCAEFQPELLNEDIEGIEAHSAVVKALEDDLNTPLAISILHELIKEVNSTACHEHKMNLVKTLYKSANLLGLLDDALKLCNTADNYVDQAVLDLIEHRREARERGDFKLADEMREQLLGMGIVLSDRKDGSTHWEKVQ